VTDDTENVVQFSTGREKFPFFEWCRSALGIT